MPSCKDVSETGKGQMSRRQGSHGWRRLLTRRVQMMLDATAIATAFLLSYLLRFEFSFPRDHQGVFLFQLPYVVAAQIAALFACGIYKLIWRYVGLAELRRFLLAAAVGVIPVLLARAALPEVLSRFRVPVSVALMTAILGFGGVLGLRVLRRLVYERFEREASSLERRRRDRKAIFLVGAGRAGVLAARELAGRGDLDIEVKGFVDDDPEKLDSVIHGLKVLGTTDDIPRLVKGLEIDHVVITIAKGSRAEILRIVEICDQVPVKARIIPGLYDILQGRVSTNPIRDVDIEDLLGREPVRLDVGGLRGFLSGRTVMVTGAGGSIGSELARQAARYEPKKLLLIDRAEPFLFQIEQEMKRHYAAIEIVPLIADVGDRERMREVFALYKPEVVLHAAAHKHVPMMESNPGEAVKNNVLGTLSLGEAAAEASCETFVLISTDKAVNPTSVMGASKRVAEMVVQGLEGRCATKFVAVRFGNVLGSTGSVIPIFKEQIRRGGPVTVTHERMTRYFMTIPEAAQLVLQAGAIGEGGEIFILDMGQPVRIIDVARDMIRLSGLRPDEDIQIHITGIRPGEKLFEELATTEDRVEKTKHPKIFVGRTPIMPSDHVEGGVRTLLAAVRTGDWEAVRRALCDLVPEATLGSGNGGVRKVDTDAPPPEVVEVIPGKVRDGAQVSG
jgi:FlaA1/EpsC-like NDP-sugar epimerase